MTRDLFDTSACPVGVRCECCGAEAGTGRGDLSVATVDTPCGVLCLTVDEHCKVGIERPEALTMQASTIVRLVKQHQLHLGRRLD